MARPGHRPFAVSTIRAANRLVAHIVAVGDNAGVAVRVSQEVMQSEDGLYETRFELFPVVGLGIAVNSEDNPLIPGMNGSWGREVLLPRRPSRP